MSKRGNNEGSVYRRRDGKWVASVSLGWVNGNRQRRTAVTGTKREASQRLAELQRSLEQGLSLDADRATVADLLRKWLEAVKPKLRPRTYIGYEMIVSRHLIPGLGRGLLKKLTPEAVEQYLRGVVAGGLSNRTAQYHHAVLRAAVVKAEKWKLVERNVVKLAEVPTVGRHDVRPLSPAQARIFLSSVEGDRLFGLFAVSLSLGLRQGEALGLQWRDVDLEERILTVQHTLQRYSGQYHLDEPKTQRSRRKIKLPVPLAEALRRHRDQQEFERVRIGELWRGGSWNLVFCTELGEPLSGPHITRRFQAKLSSLGLPAQRFHDLRHAAATFLVAQGVPLRVIMEVLGHSTITTTANVYGHVALELQEDAMERQGALLFATS